MSRFVFLFIVLGSSGCKSNTVAHTAILGTWKSNAELTLKSMNSVEGVTLKARKLFEDDFFGHLFIEIKEQEARVIDLKESIDFGYQPYEVLDVTDNHIRVKDWNDLFDKYEERTLYLEGDCYYVFTSKFQFREYFCRHEL